MLATVDRTDLIQALSPYLDDDQNLGKIVHDYVGKPFISTWQVGGDYDNKLTLAAIVSITLRLTGMMANLIKLLVLIKLKPHMNIKQLAVILYN